MRYISAINADGVWQQAIDHLLNRPDYVHKGRNGTTYEIIPCVLEIKKPFQRWILSRDPPFNAAYALVEFIWIVSGNNQSKVVNYWNPSLPNYAGAGATYHGAYGFRLRNEFKIDQIQRAYEVLSNAPETRQVALQIWKPDIDLPSISGKPVSLDIPCNMTSLLKVRDGHLHWTQVMRSNDVMRGLPYDIIQFTLLQELMASWLGVQLGSYIHVADSLHIYERDIESFKCTPNGLEYDTAQTFLLPYDESNHLIMTIYQALCDVAEGKMTKHELKDIFDRDSKFNIAKSDFFKDIISVIGSDAARRQGYVDLAYGLVGSCVDQNLKSISTSWLDYQEALHECEKGKKRIYQPPS